MTELLLFAAGVVIGSLATLTAMSLLITGADHE